MNLSPVHTFFETPYFALGHVHFYFLFYTTNKWKNQLWSKVSPWQCSLAGFGGRRNQRQRAREHLEQVSEKDHSEVQCAAWIQGSLETSLCEGVWGLNADQGHGGNGTTAVSFWAGSVS